jgi:hypothetical protein
VNNVLLRGQIEKVATKNAMSPGLWLCGISCVSIIPALYFVPQWAAICLIILLALVILSILGVFVMHSIRNPNLLRSEEFALKQQALNIYGDGKKPAEELSKIVSAPNITIPQYKNTGQ